MYFDSFKYITQNTTHFLNISTKMEVQNDWLELCLLLGFFVSCVSTSRLVCSCSVLNVSGNKLRSQFVNWGGTLPSSTRDRAGILSEIQVVEESHCTWHINGSVFN